MAIKIVNDVVVPAAVTALDLITEATVPTWNEWVAYLAAAGGYVAAAMGFGGDAAKNVGIASFDWAGKKLYTRIRSMMPVSAGASRLAMRSISAPYGGIRQTTKPEFEGQRSY